MTLQLYLLRQIALSCALALVGLGFLVVPAITVQAVQRLGGAGLGAVVRYVPLVLIELVPYLAPIAFLLGVVATFGRLAANNEWTAMAAAGVHPLRALVPGVLIAALGMLATYALLATVSPEWKYAQRQFLVDSRAEAFRGLGRGRTQFAIGDFFIDAARTDGNGTFYDVILGVPEQTEEAASPAGPAQAAEERDALVLVADKVRIVFDERFMEIFFHQARALLDDEDYASEMPYYRCAIDDLVETRKKNKNEPKYLTTRVMRARLAGELVPGEEALDAKRREDYRFEVQRRVALAATYFVFLLLGAGTGLWLRRGSQLGAMTVAIGFALLYYVLFMRLGTELAKARLIPIAAAVWSTNALFLLGGVLLTRRYLWR